MGERLEFHKTPGPSYVVVWAQVFYSILQDTGRYWRSSEKGEGLSWNSQGWLCQEEGPGESGRWLQLEETKRRWEEPGGTGNH